MLMIEQVKSVIKKIPFSVRLYYFLKDIIAIINYKKGRRFVDKVFFIKEGISKREGPVVLVSRDIKYTFPLSYAYLAGYLREKGIDIVLLFRNISKKELVKKIISLNPILVGFGNLYPELGEIKNIIYRLNKAGRDFPIVIGGQMVSPIPDFALRLTGADYGVIGEGEVTLYKLVKALQDNGDLSHIGGLAVRNKKTVTINAGKGEYIEDLSKLPEIPYELFDPGKWLNIGRWYAGNAPEQPHWRFNDRVINVHGGRGCPFECNFCYHHNRPRYRDVNVMMDEAEKALVRFDGNMLYFSDDLVIANPKRVSELIDRIKRIKRNIAYSVSTRFDILERLDDALLQELKSTGCRIMGLGIESGSDRILEIIGKNTTAKGILRGLERLKDVGILPTVSMMVGQYTETRDDVRKSIELMRKSVRVNPLIEYSFTITTPFPGSPLYDLLFKKKLVKSDEDFYKRYIVNRMGDWNQVVNLSELPSREVVSLRAEMEKSFYEEKIKAYGKEQYEKIMKICTKQRAIAKIFETKTEKEKLKDENVYSSKQLELEKKKLALMGAS